MKSTDQASYRFDWHLSYQDQVAYKVYSATEIREIEAYRSNQHTLDYMRSTYNHCGDPTSFYREIERRQGGAAVTSCSGQYPYRWTPEAFTAFIQWLKDDHEKQWRELREVFKTRYQEEPPADEPLQLYRPIYFDHDTHRWEIEPFYTAEHPDEQIPAYQPPAPLAPPAAWFDYDHQAWVENGKYRRCGHPDEMNCSCYGRVHQGEPPEPEPADLPQCCSQLEAVAADPQYQADTELVDLPILPDGETEPTAEQLTAYAQEDAPPSSRIFPLVPCPDCGHDTACGQCLVPKNGGTLYCCRCGATLDAPTPNPAEADALRRSFGTRPRRQLRPAKQDRLFDPLPQLRLSFDPGAKDDEAPHRR